MATINIGKFRIIDIDAGGYAVGLVPGCNIAEELARRPWLNLTQSDIDYINVLAAQEWTPAVIAQHAPPIMTLDEVKTGSVAEINRKCEASILSGFTSAALGQPHSYSCTRDDQANLLALIARGAGGSFTCVDGAGVKARRPHTAAQLDALLIDGQAHKEPRLDKARALKAQIESIQPSATAVAEASAVLWVFP